MSAAGLTIGDLVHLRCRTGLAYASAPTEERRLDSGGLLVLVTADHYRLLRA